MLYKLHIYESILNNSICYGKYWSSIYYISNTIEIKIIKGKRDIY